jgi:signal recognition particle subunit SRP54
MTLEERKRPQIIDGRRRRRIAKGSGTTREEVSQLIKQFEEMRKMMAQMGNMTKKGKLPKGLQGLPFDFN